MASASTLGRLSRFASIYYSGFTACLAVPVIWMIASFLNGPSATQIEFSGFFLIAVGLGFKWAYGGVSALLEPYFFRQASTLC